jgi:hypothetical protein
VKNTIRKFVWLALFGSVQLAASPPVIGVARSWGAFFVNNASVPGSATVFDGTSLKTADASSNLTLTGGERVMLASNSTAIVHPDRLSLDRGMAEISGQAAYRVEARNLRVETSDAAARIRVGIDPQNRVLVASLSGAAEVRNSQGRLVARIVSGAALSLSAAGPESVDLTGVVQAHDGKFYLTDDVTKVKVELVGKDLAKLVGKLVRITGTLGSANGLSAGASELVIVATAKVAAAAAGASAAGGAAAGAGATVAGISVTTIAVVGGVTAVGGTVGGLAATGVIGGSSSVSR